MKKLIYPISYYTDTYEDLMIGFFKGIDVRTKEEVEELTIQNDSSYTEVADFFKENDVLFMDYGKRGDFPIARIANRKLSFEEIERDYQRFKDKNISDEEINNKMIKKHNCKRVITKRMHK